MTTFLLTQLNDDGTATTTVLSDPVTVNEAITVPLAALIPPPPAPPEPQTPPPAA